MKLSSAIDRYVEAKRLVFGVSFKTGSRILRTFCRWSHNISIRSVRTWHVQTFLDRRPASDVTWLVNYRTLKAFFEFWMARNQVSELPLPRSRTAPHRNFTPYIYTLAELRQLLRWTSLRRKAAHREIDSLTLRTILLFFYGTGARANEVLAISRGDIDLRAGTVTLRRPNTNMVRTLPLGPSLLQSLRAYCEAIHGSGWCAQHFFVRRDGREISMQALIRAFRGVARKAGISRRDGVRRQPIIRDLRHTFAVHCLNAWLEEGKDPRSMLPLLAAYMGHISLSSTEKYLSVTPNRFRKQLSRLSPPSVGVAPSQAAAAGADCRPRAGECRW